jgi:hypothetical protein
MPNEHSYENDSTGLIIYGIWSCYRALGERDLIREFLPLIEYCGDWICNNAAGFFGLVKSCAGISEVFGPHLGQKCEQMVWTSAISAYGIDKAACMLEAVGDLEKAGKYRQCCSDLKGAILTHCVKNGVLYRSRESARLDASVLNFLFGDLKVFDDRELLKETVAACEKRLVDPVLGGVWRYEEAITEEGVGLISLGEIFSLRLRRSYYGGGRPSSLAFLYLPFRRGLFGPGPDGGRLALLRYHPELFHFLRSFS